MAWTGAMAVATLGTRQVRLSGATLAAGASATIGNSGAATDSTLPANFPTISAARTKVIISDATGVGMLNHSIAGATITVTNNNAVISGVLNIFIEDPHSIGS